MARFDKTDQSVDIISLLLTTTVIIIFVHDLLNIMA